MLFLLTLQAELGRRTREFCINFRIFFDNLEVEKKDKTGEKEGGSKRGRI